MNKNSQSHNLYSMTTNSLFKSAILMVIIVASAVLCWEFYLRSKGIKIAYDDGPPLWSDKRSMVYEPVDKATVFIGSSRIKFDLDIDTWQRETGTKAVQLAVEGSTPIYALENLANDENFKGKLIVDITEIVFFSNGSPRDDDALKDVNYFKERTPAQRASFPLNYGLESQFVFLDKKVLSLNALLDNLELTNRKGVRSMPIFPMDFNRNTFDRQSKMTDRFLADTSLQNKVTGIWKFFMEMGKTAPPFTEENLLAILNRTKATVDKIKARGGEVLFVRTPSSGPFLQGEKMGFPREKYWDRLLAYTNCPGIYFADYPELNHFECPEWSHLSPQDAIAFTKGFIKILNEQKGWQFQN
jgi:hypothetical protein